MENLFEYYVENENFHFKYAKGEPSLKDREFHHYHEFVFFIEGSSYFISKNIQQVLSPGSIVLIPKEKFHQFRVTNSSEYHRCILGFRETPETSDLIHEIMDEVKIISTPNKTIIDLFENMSETVKSQLTDETKRLFIQASLIQLLIYFKQYVPSEITQNINISPIVQQALTYIDENYTQKLSVEGIAKHLYISPSTLAHKFTKELNITVYQYISKKRIVSVNKLVEKGESYTEAATKSGFSDYSCFYRIYKKYYQEKT